MRYSEIIYETSLPSPTVFYHGSGKILDGGTILTAAKGSKFVRRSKLDIMQTESLLEIARPADMIPRKQSVFLVSDPTTISAAGGLTDHLYEVEAIGAVERNHTGWWGLINIGWYKLDSDTLNQYTTNYWSGIECTKRGAWEYRCKQARVIKEIE